VEIDDLRLTRALQLAPRASFARLADAVGIHERTAARRYRRLRREGILRIFGMVNPMAVGQQFWQVRVRCRPDASESLAAALAARDDIAWVGVTAAGSEISFSVRSLSVDRRDLLLTRSLRGRPMCSALTPASYSTSSWGSAPMAGPSSTGC
jgi:DNA-binding Lrp family transcriptional regulator